MLGIRLTDPVGNLVGSTVATVRPTDTLREAATLLAADHVGLLVVVDARGVYGVLSERDLVTAIADDADLTEERVRDFATTDLVQIEEGASILDAAAMMSRAEIRHLAVARKGVVTGVVSVRDVLDVLLDQGNFGD